MDPLMQHLETSFQAPDGVSLYLQAWMPEETKAALFLIHGLGEHSSRYKHVASRLVASGIAVFTFDGRGHGKSDLSGPSAYIDNYLEYLEDIHALYQKVKTFVPGKPVFLLGHSMGGGLLAAYSLAFKPEAKGIILSAPALQPADDVPEFLQKLAPLLSKWTPKLKVLMLNSKHISRDPEVVKAYNEDPLVHHGGFPARTGYELLKVMNYVTENASQFSYPVLLFHGTVDKLTNPKGSAAFHDAISSSDKTLVQLPGFFHEILNEPEKETVMNTIVEWIEKRMVD
jgi:alpha-beta hydrolase superfamily lysophospholipase